MKKEEIFQHFKMVLDDLVAHSVFFKTYLQAPDYLDFEVYGGNYGIPANISMVTGVTRACLIDENYDWVVKFDIAEDYYGSACEREEYIYNRAKKEKLNRYFAEAIYLGNYKKTFTFFRGFNITSIVYYNDCGNEFSKWFFKYKKEFGNLYTITLDIPLYAYPKVNEINYRFDNATKDELTQIKRVKSPLSDKNQIVGVEFLRSYGFEEYKRLANFLLEVDANDFHCGNIGFINDKIVLIDYAGYFDPDDKHSSEEMKWG